MNNLFSRLSFLAFSVLTGLALQLAVNSAHATGYTWVGGGGNSFWGNAVNWGGGGFPNSNTDTATNNISSTMSLADSSGVDASFTIATFSSTTGSVNVTFSNVTSGTGLLILDGGAGNASISAVKNSGKLLLFNVGVQVNTNTNVKNAGSDLSVEFRKAITGAGGITIIGQSSSSTQAIGYTYLNAASSYTGPTILNGSALTTATGTSTNGGGKLTIGGTDYLPTATILNVNANSTSFNAQGARLNLNGFNQTVAGLAGTTGTALGIINNNKSTASTSTLTINNTGDYVYNGIISDAITGGNLGKMALTKSGSGSQTLAGANTYTGDTTVSAGTLVLATNAELRFKIGSTGVNNQFLGSGTATLDGKFKFDLTTAGTTVGNSWNIINVSSLSETFGGTFTALSTLGSFTNNSGVWSISENSVTYEFSQATGLLSVVPEPSTWALLAVSLTSVMILRRRRQS